MFFPNETESTRLDFQLQAANTVNQSDGLFFPAGVSFSNSSLQLEVWEGRAVSQQLQTAKSTSFALHEQPAFFMCVDCESATLWILYWTAACARAGACIMVSAGLPWVKLQPALIIHQALLAPRQTQFSSTRDSCSKHHGSFDFTGVQCFTHTHKTLNLTLT